MGGEGSYRAREITVGEERRYKKRIWGGRRGEVQEWKEKGEENQKHSSSFRKHLQIM